MGRTTISRRWRLRMVLVLTSSAVTLGVAEGALRLYGFRYRLYPERIEFGYPNPKEMASEFVAHDRLLWVKAGYDEKLLRAREQQPDLVFMGCSCTAWGRYDEALARRLAERHDGQTLNFVNLGVAGWSSYQGLQQMEEDTVTLGARVVTLFYGWNDHWIGLGIDDRTAARLNDSILFKLGNLRLVQLVNRALLSREKTDRTGPLRRVSLEDFRDNLRRMVDLAQAHGMTPVLLTAPTSHRVGKEPKYLERRWLNKLEELVPLHLAYVEVVREVAAEKGVPLCDLYAAFDAVPEDDRVEMFREDGIHFTDPGVEKAAEELYACFEQNGLFQTLADS